MIKIGKLAQAFGRRTFHSSNSNNFLLDSSPVETITIGKSYKVHVKRDDLLGTPQYCGNKVRKLAFFEKMFSNAVSETSVAHPVSKYKKIVSFGGNQSNAMLSIAYFAHRHSLDFDYFSRPLSAAAKSDSLGNLSQSLQLGMNLIETNDIVDGTDFSEFEKYYNKPEDVQSILFLARGVSNPEAELGISQLADELWNHFTQNRHIENRKMIVFVPSGTGTTSMYLHRRLKTLSSQSNLEVNVISVSAALRPHDLDLELKKKFPNEPSYPIITHPKQRVRFGQLNKHLKAMWCSLKRKGITLDLIYGPLAWISLMELLPEYSNGHEIYYVHTGGISGNESQLLRYEKKFATNQFCTPKSPVS